MCFQVAMIQCVFSTNRFQQRLTAQRAAAKRKQDAWNEYYVQPRYCKGMLEGSLITECTQHRMDAKKVFEAKYFDAKAQHGSKIRQSIRTLDK